MTVFVSQSPQCLSQVQLAYFILLLICSICLNLFESPYQTGTTTYFDIRRTKSKSQMSKRQHNTMVLVQHPAEPGVQGTQTGNFNMSGK